MIADTNFDGQIIRSHLCGQPVTRRKQQTIDPTHANHRIMTHTVIEQVMTTISGQDLEERKQTDGEGEIQRFYAGSTVLITGATGFVGKLLLEKLLRTCEDIRKVYVLVRERKGKEPGKRLEELFECPVFDLLKQKEPDVLNRVGVLVGDCSEPELGLGAEDRRTLVAEVDVVFHCAANVRFTDPLRQTTFINVRAVRDLLRLARQMRHLKAFVYVSTAYSNSYRSEVEEKVYETKITGEKLISLCETLDDEVLKDITPNILGEHPNTYTFTKAVAEEVVDSQGKGLPVAIVRPSIIISTAKEPICGWINNFYGATGIVVGACLGVIRSLHCCPQKIADLIPVDYVVSAIVAAAWEVGTKKNPLHDSNDPEAAIKEEQPTAVYNIVSGNQNPITWETNMKMAEKYGMQIPTPLLVWYPIFKMRPNLYLHLLAVFFLQTIPAYIVDFILTCIGKKPMLVAGYKKIDSFSEVLSYFATRQWRFSDTNVQSLWRKMSGKDRSLFEFNVADLNWEEYYGTYIRGCRTYLLKDTMDTIPEGFVRYRKLQIAHYALVAALAFVTYKLVTGVCWLIESYVM